MISSSSFTLIDFFTQTYPVISIHNPMYRKKENPMKLPKFVLVVTLFMMVMLASCSQATPEVMPTNTPLPPTATASPVPPTETPTPTPTPVPYDLTVSLVDEAGISIPGAEVILGEERHTTDQDGVVSLFDLPAESVDLSVQAPGYFSSEVSETLERGQNEREIVLAVDPYGLLPANACASGESLLYLEDFQDGEAQFWDMNETPAGSWTVEPDPESLEDWVLKAAPRSGWIWLGRGEGYAYNNTVWRLRVKLEGNASQHLNFRFLEGEGIDLRYTVAHGNQNLSLGRIDYGNWMDLGGQPLADTGAWHLFEIGYFDGAVTVYLDGKQKFSWTDPNPWEGGTLVLEPMVEEGAIYYDDVSICEISAPFEPIPRPQTGYNLETTLLDVDGNPISGAPVIVQELGFLEEATQVTDDAGRVAWADLPPGDVATLELNVPGYFPRTEMVAIAKGDNQTSITLERDPNGLLAADACAPGETLVFVEDLQDSTMQGWNNLETRLQAGVPNIGIIDDPAMAGNLLLMASSPGPNTHVELGGYEVLPFGDAVWRMDVKTWKDMHLHAQWHNFGDSNYIAFIYGQGGDGGRLDKHAGGTHFEVFSWNKRIGGDDQWHTIEISTYQGEYQIWIDGTLMGRWADQDPIPEGYLGIGMDFWAADSLIYFDNVSVCALSAPFVSILDTD
jgi:hypothetical protein